MPCFYFSSHHKLVCDFMLEMEKNPDDITTKLGKRIVQIRKEKGIKQVDLAVFVNIDDSSLRKIITVH